MRPPPSSAGPWPTWADEDRTLSFVEAEVAWWYQHPTAAAFLERCIDRTDGSVGRMLEAWEAERHELAFGAGGAESLLDDGTPAERRQRSARVMRLRLGLALVLTAASQQPRGDRDVMAALYEDLLATAAH